MSRIMHPAVATANPGGNRRTVPLRQVSARNLASHTTLKVRQAGQAAPTELRQRDLKAELVAREERERRKQLGLPEPAEETRALELESPVGVDAGSAPSTPKALELSGGAGAQGGKAGMEEGDDEDDDEDDEEELRAALAAARASRDGPVDLSKFDDSDEVLDAPKRGAAAAAAPAPAATGKGEASDANDKEADDEDDDSDDEAELRRVLEKLHREKEEERRRKEQQEAEEAKARVMRGNPLLQPEGFGVKRRWDDDVVFKNQARDEPQPKKRFINDAIRSDFHRNFLRKYIRF